MRVMTQSLAAIFTSCPAWRPRALSRRAKIVIVVASLVYVTVCCYLLLAVYKQNNRHVTAQDPDRDRRYRALDSYVQSRIDERRADTQSKSTKAETQTKGLGSWFGGLVNWFKGCGDDDCVHFKFPEELPESVNNVCGDARTTRVPVVIVVSSPVEGFEERQALRDTWLIPKRNASSLVQAVRHLIVVGTSQNSTVTNLLREETARYGDILQGDFPDTAHSSPIYRTLLGLYWVTRHCKHAAHVLKVDQDAWINLPQLISDLRDQPVRLPVGLGGYCTVTKVRPVAFNPAFQRMSPGMLSNLNMSPGRLNAADLKDVFPPARCHESGYVTTPSIAEEIVNISKEVPFSTTLESIYMGLCLRKLDMKVDTLPGFGFSPRDSYWITDLCELHGRRVVLRRGFTPLEMRFIWAQGTCKSRPKFKRKLRVGLPEF